MGWALVPISWFSTEYQRQLSDITTYRCKDNFEIFAIVSNSNKLLYKLKLRFDKLLKTTNDKNLLNYTNKDNLQLPFMKLLPKVRILTDLAYDSNLNKLTGHGRPIITDHSWLTSNPSRLLGTELDKIILPLQNLFIRQDI